ncbi:Site specific recombinase, tyrosine [Operophtera brumata]|uniref:Site specific recombinase, tyrosine n=1 Tax=Operophtera brumata TaxID=104452 RepID=A0A0L7LC81_OPEBR|nr:Site specific recombinase, tyrosine [Operophtera brumata]
MPMCFRLLATHPFLTSYSVLIAVLASSFFAVGFGQPVSICFSNRLHTNCLKRIPGVSANPIEDADIDQSVATKILDRTLQYEERELYRQYDLINTHAGRIDNRTNAIIEHISEQMENATVSKGT